MWPLGLESKSESESESESGSVNKPKGDFTSDKVLQLRQSKIICFEMEVWFLYYFNVWVSVRDNLKICVAVNMTAFFSTLRRFHLCCQLSM